MCCHEDHADADNTCEQVAAVMQCLTVSMHETTVPMLTNTLINCTLYKCVYDCLLCSDCAYHCLTPTENCSDRTTRMNLTKCVVGNVCIMVSLYLISCNCSFCSNMVASCDNVTKAWTGSHSRYRDILDKPYSR